MEWYLAVPNNFTLTLFTGHVCKCNQSARSAMTVRGGHEDRKEQGPVLASEHQHSTAQKPRGSTLPPGIWKTLALGTHQCIAPPCGLTQTFRSSHAPQTHALMCGARTFPSLPGALKGQ